MYFSLRLWSYTVGARLQIALAVALGLATAATGVARLALLGWMTARVFEGESIGDLVPEIAAVVAISVARVLLQYAKESVAYTTSARVQRTVRRRLLRGYSRSGRPTSIKSARATFRSRWLRASIP